MSVDLAVYLQRSAMPTPVAWQEAIRNAGFPLEIDTDFDPDSFSGFLPCKLRGSDQGFEYFASPMSDVEAAELGAPPGSDFSVLLATHSDYADLACSIAAAAALAHASAGMLVDPQSGESFSAQDALAWAAQQFAEAERLSKRRRPETKKRWFRFSLRAFFVLITLVACVTGLIGTQMARHRRETNAIDHLKHGNHTICWASVFDRLTPEEINPLMPRVYIRKPGPLAGLRNLEMFRTVVVYSSFPAGNTFEFGEDASGNFAIKRDYKNGLRDSDMAWVNKLTNLRELWLEANGITEKGLLQLTNLKRLEILWLQHTAVGDDGMPALKNFPNLRDLDLSGTFVTDAAIPAMIECGTLQRVTLNNTSITNEGAAKLKRARPDCMIKHSNPR